jgi:hypothetical protein
MSQSPRSTEISQSSEVNKIGSFGGNRTNDCFCNPRLILKSKLAHRLEQEKYFTILHAKKVLDIHKTFNPVHVADSMCPPLAFSVVRPMPSIIDPPVLRVSSEDPRVSGSDNIENQSMEDSTMIDSSGDSQVLASDNFWNRHRAMTAEQKVFQATDILIQLNQLDIHGTIRCLVYYPSALSIYLEHCMALYPDDFSWMLTETVERNLTVSFDLLLQFYLTKKHNIKVEFNMGFLYKVPKIYDNNLNMDETIREMIENLDIDRLKIRYNDNLKFFDIAGCSFHKVCHKTRSVRAYLTRETMNPTYDPDGDWSSSPLYQRAKECGLIDRYYENKSSRDLGSPVPSDVSGSSSVSSCMSLGSSILFPDNTSRRQSEGGRPSRDRRPSKDGYYSLLGPFYFQYLGLLSSHRINKHFLTYGGRRIQELILQWNTLGLDSSFYIFVYKYCPSLIEKMGDENIAVLATCEIFRLYPPSFTMDDKTIVLDKQLVEDFIKEIV